MGTPKIKPLDSVPTTTSKSVPFRRSSMESMASCRPSASFSTLVISRKIIPGSGKSGILLTYSSIFFHRLVLQFYLRRLSNALFLISESFVSNYSSITSENHDCKPRYTKRLHRTSLFHETLLSALSQKEKVRKAGLEPARYCYHRHLKPARLPIPPLPHFCSYELFCSVSQAQTYHTTGFLVCQHLF